MNSARKHKLKLKLAAPKRRNPLVAPALQRKAGPHRKTRGGERQAEEQALRKRLQET